MIRRFWILIVPTVVSLALPNVCWASDAEGLFRQALVKESADRDLEGAITLYRQVVVQASSKPLLILQARLRMADCYEHLGKTSDAEVAYRQILETSTGPPSEITREAQANLNRLEIQDRLSQIQSSTGTTNQSIERREFIPSAFSVAIGPDFLFTKANSLIDMSLGTRYRLSSQGKPLSSFLELASVVPEGAAVDSGSEFPDALTKDSSSLRLRYQISLAFVSELPHGSQRLIIPEIGGGFAMTHSNTNIITTSTDNGPSQTYFLNVSNNIWSPFFIAGLHFCSDHLVSFVMEGTYTSSPFRNDAYIQSSPHTANLNLPRSLWGVALKMQFKIGRTKLVARR